jgi:hypothetical protein
MLIYTYSALIKLHDPQSFRQDQDHVELTLSLLRPIVNSMSWDTAIFLNGTFVKVEDASPLLLSWAYQAAKIYSRLVERYGEEFLSSLVQMREKLIIMAKRWKAGGKQFLLNTKTKAILTWLRCISSTVGLKITKLDDSISGKHNSCLLGTTFIVLGSITFYLTSQSQRLSYKHSI